MGYYGYDYYDTIGGYTSAYAPLVYAIVAILAVILGVVLFFTMLRKKNENKYSGFKAKVYHFLNVNKFYTEDIIRLLYVVTVCVLTFVGLTQIVMGSFMTGILLIVVGNVAARVSYECLLMFFVLVRKTVAIDRKLSKIEKFYGDDFDDADSCADESCMEESSCEEESGCNEEKCGVCDECCSCCGSQDESKD